MARRLEAIETPVNPPEAEVEPQNIMGDVESKLNELKSDAASEDDAQTFMEPKKKRKYTKRAQKEEDTEEKKRTEEIELTQKYLRPAFGMISNVGVKIAEDQRAAFGGEELEILVQTASQCINQYLPGALGQHAPLIVFSVTLSGWSLRVYMLRQENLARMIAERKAREGAVAA